MKKKNAIGAQTIVVFSLLIMMLVLFSYRMGLANFFSTLMATAHDLLLNTVFFIMAITVLSGAFGSFLAEFGILDLLNRFFSPVVKRLWGMPGVSALGALSAYVSDNPAIISLAKDKAFIDNFAEYQKPALTNFGTAFGMGLIVTAYMMSLGFFVEALIGNIGAIIGSIVSTHIMLRFTKKEFNVDSSSTLVADQTQFVLHDTAKGNFFQRLLNSLLEGGKNGLEIGFQIIPGVLVICTLVLMVTFGPGPEGYDGSAFQGVPLLPLVGKVVYFPMKILFGFSSPDAIAFPIMATGAVGAALALIPHYIKDGLVAGGDIAVFTAIGMCWSGYLSTHIAMMDALGYRELTSKAIISHTIGGIVAGVSANYIFLALSLIPNFL